MQRWSVGEARGRVVWIQTPAPRSQPHPWPRPGTLHTSVPSLSPAITSCLLLGCYGDCITKTFKTVA